MKIAPTCRGVWASSGHCNFLWVCQNQLQQHRRKQQDVVPGTAVISPLFCYFSINLVLKGKWWHRRAVWAWGCEPPWALPLFACRDPVCLQGCILKKNSKKDFKHGWAAVRLPPCWLSLTICPYTNFKEGFALVKTEQKALFYMLFKSCAIKKLFEAPGAWNIV